MRLSFLVAALALGTACNNTSIQSDNLKTAGMSARMHVVADGTGQSTVNVELHVDKNDSDFVDLSSGDSLVATVAAHSQTLSRSSSFLGEVSYQTAFSRADGEGTLYTVAFNRANEVSAPSSTATLPKPFSIIAPAPSGTFSRSGAITVTYDNSGTADSMTWTAAGSCLGGQKTGSVRGDSGSFTIPKGAFTLGPETCPATLTLKRTRSGQLDTHFGFGGFIDAAQTRTLSFSSTP